MRDQWCWLSLLKQNTCSVHHDISCDRGWGPKLPIWIIYWYALFLEHVFEWWNVDEFSFKNVHFHKISYLNTCKVHHDISCGETPSQNFLHEWCMPCFWNRCRMMKCWWIFKLNVHYHKIITGNDLKVQEISPNLHSSISTKLCLSKFCKHLNFKYYIQLNLIMLKKSNFAFDKLIFFIQCIKMELHTKCTCRFTCSSETS